MQNQGQNRKYKYDKESTLKATHSRSAEASMCRLKRRYPNIDFTKCIREMCEYLRARGDQNDMFDKYRVAERALYPDYGAVGLSSYNLESVAYFWMLANDPAPKLSDSGQQYAVAEIAQMVGGMFFSGLAKKEVVQSNLIPVADKLDQLVQILYECQREKNIVPVEGSFPVRFEDNKWPQDNIACVPGVINNHCAGFNHFDQDIEVIEDDLVALMMDLMRGFVAEYCSSMKSVSLKDLSSDTQDLSVLVPPHVRADIKYKIKTCLGGDYDNPNGLGLFGKAQNSYLDQCLDDAMFKNLGFDVKDTEKPEEKLQELIDRSKDKLRKANAATSSFLGYSVVHSRFNLDEVKAVIKGIIPAPTVETICDWGRVSKKSWGISNFVESPYFKPALAVATVAATAAVIVTQFSRPRAEL